MHGLPPLPRLSPLAERPKKGEDPRVGRNVVVKEASWVCQPPKASALAGAEDMFLGPAEWNDP
eukprot:9725817-Heterocapsa_arctica.AAC.1